MQSLTNVHVHVHILLYIPSPRKSTCLPCPKVSGTVVWRCLEERQSSCTLKWPLYTIPLSHRLPLSLMTSPTPGLCSEVLQRSIRSILVRRGVVNGAVVYSMCIIVCTNTVQLTLLTSRVYGNTLLLTCI